MSNELVALETQLGMLQREFAQVLANTMPVERLMRTVVLCCDRNRKLLLCDRQSLMNAAMTFAVLGLEVDNVTGQGYLVPFEDRKGNRLVVQPIIGYKGYNTLAARANITIAGGVVREGDEFDHDEGTRAFVHHKRKLGDETKRRITGSWATATSLNRPPSVKVLSIDELLAVQAKSPRGKQPPWSDPTIGFPAMCEKTGKRRLARDLPLTVFQMAARMEEANEEQQKYAWIGHDGVVVEGDVIAPKHNKETPTMSDLINPPSLEDEARMAAERGRDALNTFCRRLTKSQFNAMRNYIETLKPIAEAADNDGETTET